MSILSSLLVIFTAAALLFVVVMIVSCMLLGMKKGPIFASIRVGATVLSALLAWPITHLLIKLFDDAFDGLIFHFLGDRLDGLDEVTTIGVEGLESMGSLLVAPFLYFGIFLILRVSAAIVFLVLGRTLPLFGNTHSPATGMPIGAADGLLIAIVCLIPICGLLSTAGQAVDGFTEAVEICDSEATDNLLVEMNVTVDELGVVSDKLCKNPVVFVVHGVSRPLFNSITTTKLDPLLTHGETVKIRLSHELRVLAAAIPHGVNVAAVLQDMDLEESERIHLTRAADCLVESDWARYFAAEMIASISTNWLNGAPALGISRPNPDELLIPSFEALLTVLSTESTQGLQDDLHTMLEVIGDFAVNNMMATRINPETMIITVSQNGMMTKTLATLEANSHMAPLAAEVRMLNVRLISAMLDADALRNGEHDALIADLAQSLTRMIDQSEQARAETIHQVFEAYDYDVPEDVALCFAEQLMDDLGGNGAVDAHDIRRYMIDVANGMKIEHRS